MTATRVSTKQSVRLSPTAKHAIKQYAKEHQCSETEAINRILEATVKDELPSEPEPPKEPPKPELKVAQTVDSRSKIHSWMAHGYDICEKVGGTVRFVSYHLGIIYKKIAKARSGNDKFQVTAVIGDRKLVVQANGKYFQIAPDGAIQYEIPDHLTA